jgi:hypothetical protein
VDIGAVELNAGFGSSPNEELPTGPNEDEGLPPDFPEFPPDSD